MAGKRRKKRNGSAKRKKLLGQPALWTNAPAGKRIQLPGNAKEVMRIGSELAIITAKS